MAEDNIAEFNERVEVASSGDGEDVELAEVSKDAEAQAESTEEAEVTSEEGTSQDGRQEQLVNRQSAPAKPEEEKPKDEDGGEDGANGRKVVKAIEGETPKERALRQKIAEMTADNRKKLGSELSIASESSLQNQQAKELSPDKQAVLAKYKQAEIDSLKEVLPIIAEGLGFVRADQLTAQSYKERSEGELDTFLQAHPEYMPENDPESVLWGRFKQEFNQYRPPQNPKDYRKIFNKVHAEIFGIQPTGDKGAIIAGQRKIQVASHAGSSGPTRTATPDNRPRTNTSGLRLDMLKGFTDEEKEDIAESA